jgi:hypothetical protein
VSESTKDSEVEFAGGLSVRGAPEVPGSAPARASLLGQHAPSRLAEQDATLWGPEAQPEASIRLGWVDTFRRSRDLLVQLRAVKAELAGLDHVVLAGMGGSSLAPEVIARTLGVGLTVLDTTDPHQVRSALSDRSSSSPASLGPLWRRTRTAGRTGRPSSKPAWRSRAAGSWS